MGRATNAVLLVAFSVLCADGTRIDPAACVHLSNGARIERINWLGNTGCSRSARGDRMCPANLALSSHKSLF